MRKPFAIIAAAFALTFAISALPGPSLAQTMAQTYPLGPSDFYFPVSSSVPIPDGWIVYRGYVVRPARIHMIQCVYFGCPRRW